MEQKEIVWAEIPFSDHSDFKIRPAVIVSNLDSGKIAFPSRIRADKILYLKKIRVLKTFGVLSNQKFEELIKKIHLLVARK